jgi:hypothetical protein
VSYETLMSRKCSKNYVSSMPPDFGKTPQIFWEKERNVNVAFNG